MKKSFLTGFLLLLAFGLLVYGSKLFLSQVADSPPGIDLVSVDSQSPGREEYSTPAQRGDSLSVGDQFPSQLVFSEVINHDSEELYVSDFEGKYVILQFWATWCSASSGSLPKAQQLQDKYQDQVQFIPVTYESREKVEKKLDFYSSLRSLDLPMIVNERRLSALFPHISLPHLIILDPRGKVVAITGWQDMNEANLEELIATGSAGFRLKSDTSVPFSFEQNLISGNTHLPSKNIRFQSALTGYLPGVPGGLMDDREDGAHIVLVNNPLLKFYRLAYTGRDLANYFGPNRMELEGFEEDELTTRKSGLDYIEWMEEGNRVFSYELIAPPGVDQYQLMREDLRRYFPEIQAEIRIQKRKVWAIVLPEGKSYPQSTAERSYSFNPYEAKLRNYPLLGLVYQLNIYSLQRSPYPLIDLTGIDHPIDLDLKANFSQPEELKKALQEAGLDLELRETEIPVLHLKKLESLTQK
ncbi:TlpA family protein disulfide reductase [Algoriphagus formosus]|uniref:TlpA family protein disulfide reductase n=1 Tax=Algoriphagus formosus TaxID=2007308 RepID=A0A4R5UVR3_9BACT|nr:TlpA disulfide reductase family protein [Algoriphagus aquimaris]TDK43344.1 TlpA family protein disulfide reductase [Algoriphagus aquimaris]